MKGTPAIYRGRIVEKKNFRTWVYGVNGARKLVESWDAFEAAMQSGIWFASKEDAAPVEVDEKSKPKPKAKSKSKLKVVKVEPIDEPDDVLVDDGSVFEVTDDFLPKENA